MPYNTVLKTNDAKRLKTIIEVKVAVYIFFMIKEEMCILNNEDFRLAAFFLLDPIDYIHPLRGIKHAKS